MDIKLLLLLLALFHSSNSGCPSVCDCTNTSVLCMERGLDTIPNFETLENDPVIIDLSGNKIDLIGPDDLSFEKTMAVKEVYLNNSELYDIDYEAFDEMENLQELYLNDNLLNSIPDNLIEDLPDMVLLDLSNNYFFEEMPVIKSKSLEVLVLANCKITNITSNSLKHLPNLRILLLQQNNIKYIDPKVFDSVPNMFFVRLSYNSWECNCSTMELFAFLAKKKFVDPAEPYKCSYPDGKFVDIFGKQGVDAFRNTCTNEKNQTEKLVSHPKDYKYLTKQEYFLLKKNKSHSTEEDPRRIMEETVDGIETESVYDKSYSLVRENDARKRDSGTEDPESKLEKNLDNSTDDSSPDLSAVTPINNVIEFTGCDSPEYIIPGIQMRLDLFLFIILSFLVGSLVGFTLNQFLNSGRYRRLDTSDSTTRLKTDFN
nr:reticulon-4 receptor-like 1 [Leptinotarsa decemlineata]